MLRYDLYSRLVAIDSATDKTKTINELKLEELLEIVDWAVSFLYKMHHRQLAKQLRPILELIYKAWLYDKTGQTVKRLSVISLKRATLRKPIQWDHIKPLANWGKSEFLNFEPIRSDENQSKGSSELVGTQLELSNQWVEWLKPYILSDGKLDVQKFVVDKGIQAGINVKTFEKMAKGVRAEYLQF